MATFAFDTLEAKQSLTDAGVEDRPAIAIVGVARKSVPENVATKEDIADLKADLKAELKTDIAELKVHMMFGLLAATGIIIAATGVMIAAFTFLGN